MRKLMNCISTIICLGAVTQPAAAAQAVPDPIRSKAGWVIETPELQSGGPARFAGRYLVQGRRVVIQLDSATAGTTPTSVQWVALDSVVTSIALDEKVVEACAYSVDSITGVLVAIVRDSVDSNWEFPPPRVAWLLDLATLRIKPVEPTGLVCVQEYAGD